MDVFPLPRSGREFFRHLRGAIENSDRKAFRFHVEDEIFAHDGEADEANITLLRVHFAYLLAGAGCQLSALPILSAWQFPFWEVSITNDRLEFPRPRVRSARPARSMDFWGVVRALEDGREIDGIEYEAHQAMAEHQMNLIAEKAAKRILPNEISFCIIESASCPSGEASLFLRVAAGHRAAAFSGSQWLIQELKQKVPIWKRPVFKDKEPAVDKKMSKRSG